MRNHKGRTKVSIFFYCVLSFPSLKDFFICTLGIKSSTGRAVPSKQVAGDLNTLLNLNFFIWDREWNSTHHGAKPTIFT